MPCPVRLWASWPRWLLTIIINNVYAFQYPTKNRCTILVQPSFAKLVLLPIREAYEWKPPAGWDTNTAVLGSFLLPIREAYEWKRFMTILGGLSPDFLLPIREAYEWKPLLTWLVSTSIPRTCFQFVKRMNGNFYLVTPSLPWKGILASNSWSVWMETKTTHFHVDSPLQTCFQFVKSMNGNSFL